MDETQWVVQTFGHVITITERPRQTIDAEDFTELFRPAIREILDGRPAYEVLSAFDGGTRGYKDLFGRMHDEGRL